MWGQKDSPPMVALVDVMRNTTAGLGVWAVFFKVFKVLITPLKASSNIFEEIRYMN